MKQVRKLFVLLILGIFLISLFGLIPGKASVSQDYNGKEITTTDPIILKVNKNFEESAIDSNSNDFDQSAKFEIESKSGETFTIYWEHNGTHLHSFITTSSTGYIALGWRLDKPEILSGEVMNGANIIIGHQYDNGTEYVRDDYGIAGNHNADTVLGGTNDLVFSSVTNNAGTVTMEFVYPLTTTDPAITDTGNPADVNLSLSSNNWAYFIMSASDTPDENLMTYHQENRHVISKPVYLQKETEQYPESLKESANIIDKPIPGGFTLDFGFLNAIFGNLISDGDFTNAVLPFTAMLFFLLFIGAGFFYLVINARKNKWNLSSTLIPIAIIAVFIGAIFLFPLPRIAETTLGYDQVDVQIVIEAQIKPWTFNATVYQNKLLDPTLTEFADPESVYNGEAYQLNQLVDPSTREMLGVDYVTDPDYGGLKTTAYTVFYGQTVRFVLKALDTEHGFVVGAEAEPELDYFGNPLVRTLPQHEILELYWTAPENDLSIVIRCSFFCGAGHAGMFLNLNVVAPPVSI